MKVKIGQKGASLFFFLPAEISRSLGLEKGDIVNVNMTGSRGVFSKVTEKYIDTNLTISFEDALSMPNSVYKSFVNRSNQVDQKYSIFHDEGMTIREFTNGQDDGYCMFFCDSRLEGIILRDAFRSNGFEAILIYEEPCSGEIENWKPEPIVLSNMSFDMFSEFVEMHRKISY